MRKQTLSPEEEAGLFAADRLDHSHGWILPRLNEGKAVVCGRNIHSSLVYQGIVGGIGLEKAAQINSAALIQIYAYGLIATRKSHLRELEAELFEGFQTRKSTSRPLIFKSGLGRGTGDSFRRIGNARSIRHGGGSWTSL